jgi:drug/metabolite transporter (DMT)-like permease
LGIGDSFYQDLWAFDNGLESQCMANASGGGEVLILALAMDLPGIKLVLVSDILLFIWLVVPASILSFGFWFSALKLGGAAVTSGYLFLIPLFTALISVPVLNASFAPMQLLGGVAVGAAVWLMSRSSA